MPLPYKSIRPHPGKPERRLCDVDGADVIVKVRCGLCRRTIHFLAADLAEVLGKDRPLNAIPFPCSRCKTAEFINVRVYWPESGEYGSLPVRRPGPVKQSRSWHTVRLGDEPPAG